MRPARPGDAATVGDLVRTAYSKYVERIGKEPAPMLEDHDASIRDGEMWVLEGTGGGWSGMLVMRPIEDRMFVDNVAVAPGQQGRGLGRRLVTFAEERTKEAGLSEIRLYTNEKMHENPNFYGKLGFEEIDRRLDGGGRAKEGGFGGSERHS